MFFIAILAFFCSPLKFLFMKNTLFALALFAVVGTAAAQDGKPSKKDKKVASKAVCVKGDKGDACCAKKSTTTAQVKALPASPAPTN